MPTDPNVLMDRAKCIDCAIPPGMQLPVLIAMFSQAIGVTDPNALIDMAKCTDCNIPPGMELPVIIALIDEAMNS